MNDSQTLTPGPVPPDAVLVDREALKRAIQRSRDYLFSVQAPEGYWVAELESNVTVTAEMVIFYHFMEIAADDKVRKIANHILATQQADGGWPLFYGNASDVSLTVESYIALKLAGIPADRPEMARARQCIARLGGIRKCRVFTRIFLALLGQLSWDTVPALPVEAFLLPPGFYFNIYEMSSWSRSTVVPLLVVAAHQPVKPPPPGRDCRELFTPADYELDLHYSEEGLCWRNVFIFIDKVLKALGKIPWKPFRRFAIECAAKWILEHQEPEGDWGGIQPPMLYGPMALKMCGFANDHPAIVKGLQAIDRFYIEEGDTLRFQACVSPLWDTAIAGNALLDSGVPADDPRLTRAAEWILKKQITSTGGDWRVKNPHTPSGGWAFEFYNQFYPDTDDTAEILRFLHGVRLPDEEWKKNEFQRALNWLLSMQSANGGWGAFDQDNDHVLFNEIPFADHGAMLDPPTVDIAGRVLWLMGILRFEREHPSTQRALEFVRSEQEPEGCWFGRWGVNYIYGTWLVLTGLRSMGEDMNSASIRRAVRWLVGRQNPDGGWGESCLSYTDREWRGKGESTASQTAWAVMALLSAGETDHSAVHRGINFLIQRQNADGSWSEAQFTGTGFPGHFYINYHMYRQYFPLMALSRYH
jgi:squalene-hopene/tetraprenyl-beta-curcumene cyclase